MEVSEKIVYLGVNDTSIDLFEGQYRVPNGISYNSYLIKDRHCAVMDTVDERYVASWLSHIQQAGVTPDYLVVLHMEPDHSAGIAAFAAAYPGATVVSSAKAFAMMDQFFGPEAPARRQTVAEGDTLPLGEHTLHFVAAPMVHWPEVMVAYESTERVLFSADGFGRFGMPDDSLWDHEARRYYIGIVGKYGMQVQSLLKKAAALDIAMICPLHGPILRGDLSHYLSLYDKWSSYTPEESGVVIAYASVYGHTKAAALALAEQLRSKGETNVLTFDLCRCDIHHAVACAFRFDRLVLCSITYNADVFPAMKRYIHHLCERGFQKRTVALVENGSWAPMAQRVMRGMLEGCKALTVLDTAVTLRSALSGESGGQLAALAEALVSAK